MQQGKRARNSSKVVNISSGGKRAKSMNDHYQAISNKRRFIIFLSCFAIIVIITAFAMGNSIKKLNDLNEQKDVLIDQKEDLEMTGERLQEEVEFTSTKEFVEYMARKLLGWINPSDTKYIITE